MVDESWQPKKLEVLLEAPDFLDLSHLRALPGATSGSSLRDGEVAMPEEVGAATQASAALPEVPAEAEQAVVMQLVSMGFSENGFRRAALATSNNAETAMEWIFAHMESDAQI